MQDALVAQPKPPIPRIAAWLMMLLGMWLALKLGLVVTLLSGLLVFQLTHLLASTVEGRLPPGRARAIAVIVLSAIIISALVLIQMEPVWQLAGIAVYTLVSLLSLAIVNGLIGSGHKLSGIQRWREKNKRFLQFAAGSGLLILGFYVYVDQVVSVTAFAYGGR